MSELKKDHVLGAGSAAVAGGVAGAAIGAVIFGPPGLAVGAAAGGVLGAVVGNRASEATDPRDDLGHFQQMFKTMPYYIDGHDWHDYAPAYRFGLDRYHELGGGDIAAVESQLQGRWEAAARYGSRLSWPMAAPAVRHAWQSLAQARRRSPPVS